MPEPNSAVENVPEEEIKDEWLIRPCVVYKEEYADCTSIKARFHQYFIHGEILDCKQWKIDYENCNLWTEHKNKKACYELINSEKTRRVNRLKDHYKNDIWERRDKPPENWNAPLPKWLEERNSNSYLKIVNEKLKETKNEIANRNFCTIM
ncbi:hypothetical protein E2986_09081 [Frieseomelitta varia]|uniref:Synaptic plasticity regulator PANTS n=1 Tax=Frieseomelitta varia TaxID=561572 RepID=A0A833RD17_9HYME|nr:UPF0545 protein C22orf39 homolog isoform X1 [Frieseomelitta varia]XP_043525904.1 UPF0545 protein C22orf39 homolog isoform X1 [Frieseomelitta varia]KAF3421149.1 hypothetical protein E2986_09081 [Frieseomelitta varia]